MDRLKQTMTVEQALVLISHLLNMALASWNGSVRSPQPTHFEQTSGPNMSVHATSRKTRCA